MVRMAAAIAPTQVSAFDTALGIGPECLSAEKLVRVLFEGIEDTSLSHLLGCTTCQENLVAFTKASQDKHSDVVANALGQGQEPYTNSS
jgi:hypothetical protein